MSVSALISRLETAGCHPRPDGPNSWRASCPAHGGTKSTSLAIKQADDGRTLVHCHAEGCSAEAIVSALGLSLTDLAPASAAHLAFARMTRASKPASSSRAPAAPAPASKARAFASIDEAAESVLKGLEPGSRFVRAWEYTDASGETVGAVLRFDLPTPEGEKQRKEIRPLRLDAEGWRIGAMSEPRPLYRLPELLAAPERIAFVVEGEKACDALDELGLLAVTCAGGAKAAGKTSWEPLSGRRVVIWPDNDPSGFEFAEEVRELLEGVAASVSMLEPELLGLGAKEDAFDLIEARRAQGLADEQIREEVFAALAEAEVETEPKREPLPEWKPFPVECLPPAMRALAVQGAEAIRVDASMLAAPALVAACSAIGNAAVLELKRTWQVPSILWLGIVARSGSKKSAPLFEAVRPLERINQRLALQHAEAMREFEQAEADFRAARGPDKGERPVKPRPEFALLRDCTAASLVDALAGSPRGLMMFADELSGWFGGFERFSGNSTKASPDEALWLQCYNGRAFSESRRGSGHVHVPAASVSVCGGIQPRVLQQALSVDRLASGLAARLLLVNPPERPVEWTDAEVDSQVLEAWDELVRALREEVHLERGEFGSPAPMRLRLSGGARALWIEFYNAHGRERAETECEVLRSFLSKVEELPARLAIVLHLCEWASGPRVRRPSFEVNEQVFASAIRLAEWFKAEGRRVYSLILAQDPRERERAELIEWVRSKGGRTTARELKRSSRKYAKAEHAETALAELVREGFGAWNWVLPSRKGGRPTREFVLPSFAGADVTETSENPRVLPVSSAQTPVFLPSYGEAETQSGEEVSETWL